MLLCCIDCVPPTSYVATCTPGISLASDHGSRPVGTPSRICWFMIVCCTFDLVSTVGDSPVTVIVSDMLPTSSLAFTVATNAALIAMSPRSHERNPCSSNLRWYEPGGRRSNRYVPVASVVRVCAPPINLSPVSVTVTPGRTRLLASVTLPAMAPVCTSARAGAATSRTAAHRRHKKTRTRLILLPLFTYTFPEMKALVMALVALPLAASAQSPTPTPDPQTALVRQYCTGCH